MGRSCDHKILLSVLVGCLARHRQVALTSSYLYKTDGTRCTVYGLTSLKTRGVLGQFKVPRSLAPIRVL